MTAVTFDPTSRTRPIDFATVAIAIGAALISYGVAITLLIVLRTDSATAGVSQYLVSGLAPLVAVAIVYVVRVRDLAALGFRKIAPRWILISLAAGVGAVLLSILATIVTVAVSGPPSDLQADYQAASSAGPLMVALALFAGAVLTPLGEELFFRGVITNWLLRFGGWVAIPVGAAIFAVSHGINYITVVAFVVGVIAGLLFRATGSIWPSVIVHAVNNAYAVLAAALLV
jgi:uncharacterized protein